MNERTQAMARAYIEEGLTYEQIAERYGVSRQRVGQLIGRLGVSGTKARASMLAREQRLRASHATIMAGESTLEEEAARLGFKHAHSLRSALYRLGLRVVIEQPVPEHGTLARYLSHRYRCRCEDCRRANRERMAELKGREPPQHGTYSGYLNYECRCRDCKEAARVHMRAKRAAKRQEGVAA